jgi:hypothetical protein
MLVSMPPLVLHHCIWLELLDPVCVEDSLVQALKYSQQVRPE